MIVHIYQYIQNLFRFKQKYILRFNAFKIGNLTDILFIV
jgi:hypothetical protein